MASLDFTHEVGNRIAVRGIIIATGTDRAGLEAIMREDPFYAHGLADVRIVEFRASQHADDLQQRLH